MTIKVLSFVVLFVFIIVQISCSSARLNSMPDINLHYSKSISDLKETIVKGLGSQLEGVKVSSFDLKDALVATSMEFDLEIDNKVLPIKLLEDVNEWDHVDFPAFLFDDQARLSDDEKGLLLEKKEKESPRLAPFQLAGPLELWIQDAMDMRLFLPNDVDAGELNKVILADGAVVTVHGAKSVSLRHPIELPLPFNKTNDGFASGLFTLADHLLNVSRTQSQLISLCIVGPASLSSPATSSDRLKLKRLAPGLVQLSAFVPKPNSKTSLSTIHHQQHSPPLFTQDGVTTFWPVSSINGSNSDLRGVEKLISAVLDSTGSKSDSFKVLKVNISAQTLLKLGFAVEKKLTGKESFWEGYPEWRTKPEKIHLHYEVLAKVDGEKLVPEKVVQVDDVIVEDTVAPSVLARNIGMSWMPVVRLPFSPFAL